MEMASMEPPLTAMCIKRNLQAREIQELIMTRRARKPPRTLEVHVMFEPNREAQHMLHKAYSFLLPMTRRRRLPPVEAEAISSETQDQMRERKLP
jgi:hypothetical protein